MYVDLQGQCMQTPSKIVSLFPLDDDVGVVVVVGVVVDGDDDDDDGNDDQGFRDKKTNYKLRLFYNYIKITITNKLINITTNT